MAPAVAFALDVDREVVNDAVLESEAVLSAAPSGHFRCFRRRGRILDVSRPAHFSVERTCESLLLFFSDDLQ